MGSFLKGGSNILCTPIANICNLSIKLASFPNKYKVAKIKPLYKKGLKTDPKNFVLIELLPLISNIIEQVIHDQTMNFRSDNNVLYKYQSGFRKFHSTDTCLSYQGGSNLKEIQLIFLTYFLFSYLMKSIYSLNVS